MRILFTCCLLLFFCCGCGRKETKNHTDPVPLQVSVTKLVQRDFRHVFRVQGTVEAREKAVISAFVPGRIDKIFFAEGDAVKAGSPLFQIDLVNLTDRVNAAKNDLQTLEEMEKAAEHVVKLSEIRIEKASVDFERNQKLFRAKAVSSDTFESYDVGHRNAEAFLALTESIRNSIHAKVIQAQTALKMAEQLLKDSHPAAPFDGIVMKKFKDEAEFAAPGVPVVYMENPATKEISCLISALYYEKVKTGTPLEILFEDKTVCKGTVTYRSESVDPLSRTFEIKAALPPDTPIRSGTLCDVNLILESRRAQGVPNDLILSRRGGRQTVFIVQNGMAKEIQVQTGIVDSGCTEILNASELENQEIISEGQYFINDGSPVSVPSGKK